IFLKRMPHYVSFEMKVIPDIKNAKNLSEEQQKDKEGELILQQILSSDELILLDENGLEASSVDFARFLEKKMLSGIKRLVFVIGGTYGFSGNVYSRAIGKISLSKMTFSHQMVRLIFAEQLYRAFTILKGEPYHHQ
ncbi:MAG: 23S rRNA (pseudouridine(1915)-N(3))-methyltransferase RlmH, partial [Bacteroidota bacterium]|nr:23S rRNA (pseudouridine(1915)-N(3))-methyltransferase RlmH [Bacteroidota bacterium]